MFNLGFTMEELMFPEHYQCHFLSHLQSTYFLANLDESSSSFDERRPMALDDEEWCSTKESHSDLTFRTMTNSVMDDQSLSLSNYLFENDYRTQMKSAVELDETINAMLLPNLSIRIMRAENSISTHSDSTSLMSSSFSNDHRLLTTNSTRAHEHRASTRSMSKSISSLSFSTQSSTSSNSIGDMSPKSTESGELFSMTYQPSESAKQYFHHHGNYNASSGEDVSHGMNRRRRKRTIFSAADIEHLKEAFNLNPKPSQQDIAVLSDELGHDSYVIRVWFYNKRQAAKKQMG